jgi:hypothetical protein
MIWREEVLENVRAVLFAPLEMSRAPAPIEGATHRVSLNECIFVLQMNDSTVKLKHTETEN